MPPLGDPLEDLVLAEPVGARWRHGGRGLLAPPRGTAGGAGGGTEAPAGGGVAPAGVRAWAARCPKACPRGSCRRRCRRRASAGPRRSAAGARSGAASCPSARRAAGRRDARPRGSGRRACRAAASPRRSRRSRSAGGGGAAAGRGRRGRLAGAASGPSAGGRRLRQVVELVSGQDVRKMSLDVSGVAPAASCDVSIRIVLDADVRPIQGFADRSDEVLVGERTHQDVERADLLGVGLAVRCPCNRSSSG